jgi:ABC-type branched-subunit amino acid transport system ATPase component
VRDVGYSYGGVWAVKGCTFSVPRGAVTGVIGPNGAGKSTMLQLLSGALAPREGEIVYEGSDIAGAGPAKTARLGIIRTFQIPRLLSRLPVIENVMIAAPHQLGEHPFRAILARRSWKAQEDELRDEAVQLLVWLGLKDHLLVPAGTLSGGQRRLLEIARALMAHPKVLLLDEPSAGVFPETSLLIADHIRTIASRGVTVIVIAHNIGFLAAVTDDVVVMAEGRVLTRGTLDEVRSHEEVISAYLGVPAEAITEIPRREAADG